MSYNQIVRRIKFKKSSKIRIKSENKNDKTKLNIKLKNNI